MKVKISKKELEHEYVTNHKTCREIGKKFRVGKSCINYWLAKYKIPTRRTGGGNLIDIKGHKFDKLLVLERVPNDNGTHAKWLCKCDCGNKTEVISPSLRKGLTSSCGCNKFNTNWRGYKKLSGCYWHRIVKGAEKRGLKLSITIKYAWQQFVKQREKCALSGIPIKIVTDYTRRHKEHTASLDRIDNSFGYIPDNIQWVHRRINIMRRELNVDEFLIYCYKVVEINEKRIRKIV